MIEVKTLVDDDLCLWVARTIGYEVKFEGGKWCVFDQIDRCWRSLTHHGWCPDRNWLYGGPLVEQFNIAIAKGANQIVYPGWQAKVGPVTAYDTDEGRQFGPTPLIAAMRALVWSVYGDTVPDEVAP